MSTTSGGDGPHEITDAELDAWLKAGNEALMRDIEKMFPPAYVEERLRQILEEHGYETGEPDG